MDDKTNLTPSRKWRVLLAVSLALNLIVVGFLAGTVVSGRFGASAPRTVDLGVGPIARALNRDERRDIVRGLRQDRSLRGIDWQSGNRSLIGLLRAEPFDPAAFQAQLDRQSAHATDLRGRAQSLVVERISQMSAQRRKEFADRFEQELRRRPSRSDPSGG